MVRIHPVIFARIAGTDPGICVWNRPHQRRSSQKSSFLVGVDHSASMLEYAYRRLRPHGRRFELVEGDMRSFSVPDTCDAVVCACDGVNYLLNTEDLCMFFDCAFRSLRSPGIFTFDISSAWKIEKMLGDELFLRDEEEYTLLWQNEFDPEARHASMHLTTFFRQSDGLYVREDEEHVQRAWDAEEICSHLHNEGFSNIRAYTFGTRDEIKEDTPRIQFVATKGENNE